MKKQLLNMYKNAIDNKNFNTIELLLNSEPDSIIERNNYLLDDILKITPREKQKEVILIARKHFTQLYQNVKKTNNYHLLDQVIIDERLIKNFELEQLEKDFNFLYGILKNLTNKNATAKYEKTVLHVMSHYSNLGQIKKALKLDVDPHQKDKFDMLPFDYAHACNNQEVALYYLNFHSLEELKKKDAWPYLHNLVMNHGRNACLEEEQSFIIKFLDFFKNKPELYQKDSSGQNILHVACQVIFRYSPPMKAQMIEKIVEIGFSLNEPDNDGNTPLHYLNNHTVDPAVLKILSHFNFDVSLKNKEGYDFENTISPENVKYFQDFIEYCKLKKISNSKKLIKKIL